MPSNMFMCGNASKHHSSFDVDDADGDFYVAIPLNQKTVAWFKHTIGECRQVFKTHPNMTRVEVEIGVDMPWFNFSLESPDAYEEHDDSAADAEIFQRLAATDRGFENATQPPANLDDWVLVPEESLPSRSNVRQELDRLIVTAIRGFDSDTEPMCRLRLRCGIKHQDSWLLSRPLPDVAVFEMFASTDE